MSALGTKLSQESKDRISKANKGKAKSEQHKANLCGKMTPERRQEMVEIKAKLDNSHTQESKDKISKATKGVRKSDDMRRHMSGISTGSDNNAAKLDELIVWNLRFGTLVGMTYDDFATTPGFPDIALRTFQGVLAGKSWKSVTFDSINFRKEV